jgi:hypothetical protein
VIGCRWRNRVGRSTGGNDDGPHTPVRRKPSDGGGLLSSGARLRQNSLELPWCAVPGR